MTNELEPIDADDWFFQSLLKGDGEALKAILTDDFILVDVMGGSEITKPALLEVIGAGQLKFEAIAPADRKTRSYGDAAVVTGRTQMTMRLGNGTASVNSRYTHVFVRAGGGWRLASAQGTQIAPPPG